jgi:hypothetical protein
VSVKGKQRGDSNWSSSSRRHALSHGDEVWQRLRLNFAHDIAYVWLDGDPTDVEFRSNELDTPVVFDKALAAAPA